MSRSYKKTIAFGREGRESRKAADLEAKKARKEGKPVQKEHHRYSLQTEQDYIDMAKAFMNVENKNRLTFATFHYSLKLKEFLKDRELTPELAEEFGKMMYKKERSR